MEKLTDLTQRMAQLQKASAFGDLIRWRALGQPLQTLPNTPAHDVLRKAAVAAVIPGEGDPLLAASTQYVQLIQEATILGRLTGTVPAAPYQPVIDVPVDVVGDWITEGTPIPAQSITTGSGLMGVGQLATIFGISKRLLESPDQRANRAIQAAVIAGLRRLEDRSLLSTSAAVAGLRPAGLLSAAPNLGGGSPADLETALELMFAYVSDGQPQRPYLITSPRAALWMALQRTSAGARFPNARVDGTGDVAGIRLLTSPAARNLLILIDAAKLAVSDLGLDVDSSRQASIQMLDNPTNSAATGTATNMIAAFQGNVAFVRLIRFLSWALAADDAVAYTEIDALAGSPS